MSPGAGLNVLSGKRMVEKRSDHGRGGDELLQINTRFDAEAVE